MRSAVFLLALTSSLASIAQTPPAPVPVERMAPDAHPSLALVTIHPHDPSSGRGGFTVEGSRYRVGNQSVASLMTYAYGVHPTQIVAGPDWSRTERYDIEATWDMPGAPSRKQQQEMMQKLLADRFKLHLRRENQELSVYAIQVTKGGPKLKSTANPEVEPDGHVLASVTLSTQAYTQICVNMSMKDFAEYVQFLLDRPAVDQTGVTGRYDFTLRYTGHDSAATEPPTEMFTAIQEQLGLKLQPVKAPMDLFVIDHVERPSED